MENLNPSDFAKWSFGRAERPRIVLEALALVVGCFSSFEVFASLVGHSGERPTATATALLAGHGAWGLVAAAALLISLQLLRRDAEAIILVRAAYLMTVPWVLVNALCSVGACAASGAMCFSQACCFTPFSFAVAIVAALPIPGFVMGLEIFDGDVKD